MKAILLFAAAYYLLFSGHGLQILMALFAFYIIFVVPIICLVMLFSGTSSEGHGGGCDVAGDS